MTKSEFQQWWDKKISNVHGHKDYLVVVSPEAILLK